METGVFYKPLLEEYLNFIKGIIKLFYVTRGNTMKIKFKNDTENLENIQHVQSTNFKRAKYFLKISAIILVFDLLTYLIALELNLKDFGIFFEIASLFFVMLSFISITKQNLKSSKIFILLSSFSLLPLALYDILEILINLEYYLYRFFNKYISIGDFLFLTIFAIFTTNYLAYKCILKTNPEFIKSSANKDWFYEEK